MEVDVKSSFRLTDEQVAAVASANDLGEVRSVRYATKGITNPGLFINEAFVLRINNRDIGNPKFLREALAFPLAEKAGVPVPKVVALDRTCTILPWDYLITTLVPGTPLDDLWPTLTSAEREKFGFQSGEIFARINSVEFKSCGDVNHPTFGTGLTWQEYMTAGLETRLSRSRDNEVFEPATYERISRVFGEWIPKLRLSRAPVLVHGDLQISNMCAYNGAVSGVFDFEWALSGDGEYEFRTIYNAFEKMPGGTAAFLAGYSSVRPFSADFPRNVLFYQLLWRFGITTLAKLYWGEKVFALCSGRVYKLLDMIEREEPGPSVP